MSRPWQIWIDTGGTFTDCIGKDPQGVVHTCKVLSSGALRDRIESVDDDGRLFLCGGAKLPDGFLTGYRLSLLGSGAEIEILDHESLTGALQPAKGALALEPGQAVELRSGEEAPLVATRLVTGTPLGGELPPVEMRLATTRGTNALLERRGARTVHFTTAGFEDLLVIGDQTRSELFALRIDRSEPLPELVVGIGERLSADGFLIEGLDHEAIAGTIRELRGLGIEGASIALLHAHRNSQHEEALEKLLLEGGFTHISRSSTLSPFQGLLRRSQTATTDAYLGPVISDYLGAVRDGLGDGAVSLHVMTSAGGLVNTESFRAMDSLLSGPAGGVVGAAMSGQKVRITKIIAFDMGGTSTDVSRFDGDFEYVFNHRVGPVELAAPALAIETVAAGGGSICRVERGRLAVGPQSAGADPGPASYGAGGPLTITDVNLLLGRLVPGRFPIPIDLEAARTRLRELRVDLGSAETGIDEEILAGLLRIADERMAEAIRHISVRKGVDPSGYSLVAFGGAGGQHACQVAELLGMTEIVLPGDAGLLSAKGLGHAVIERFAQREVLLSLGKVGAKIEDWFSELEAKAAFELRREGVTADEMGPSRRIVELRYLGQDASLELVPAPGGDLASDFKRRYYELFSYRPSDLEIEVVSIRVVMRSSRERVVGLGVDEQRPAPAPDPASHQSCYLDGEWRDVPCHHASDLEVGAVVEGPALIQQAHSALVVPSLWRVHGLGDGGVVLRAREVDEDLTVVASRRESSRAVELELMSHR